jgi:hypothetical protein
MGNFSYISENRGEALLNPWHGNSLCELQLVIGGKVIEKLRGVYNGYGAVDLEQSFSHLILEEDKWVDISEETSKKEIRMSGQTWKSLTWDRIVNIHFSNSTDGIAAWHLNSMDQQVAESTFKSENDENQGDIFLEDELDDDDDDDDENY